MFDKFINRYVIKGDLLTETAMHIGASNEEFVPNTVDNKVLKDNLGNPFIPGSSIKGVLRSFLERILKANDEEVCMVPNLCSKIKKLDTKQNRDEFKDKLIKEGKLNTKSADEDFYREIYDKVCTICRIFGSNVNASKFMIRDAKVKEESFNKEFEIRNGVTIDRDTNTAVKGALYEVEVVPAGTVFEFEAVVENIEEKEWEYILYLLKTMEDGDIEIGGLTSRGLGKVTLQNVTIEKIDGKNIMKSILKNEKEIIDLKDEISNILGGVGEENV